MKYKELYKGVLEGDAMEGCGREAQQWRTTEVFSKV
jgi:hypothetical protein